MTTANYKDLPCLACNSAGSVDLRINGEHVETIICSDCDGIGYLVAKRAEEQRESQAALRAAQYATLPTFEEE